MIGQMVRWKAITEFYRGQCLRKADFACEKYLAIVMNFTLQMQYNYNNTTVFNGIIFARCYMTYVVKSPSRSYIINNIIACMVNFLLAILGTFLNAMVIWIFWRTTNLREKTCYFMIMLLSCVDLSVTAIVQPMFLINSISEMIANPRCSYKIMSQTMAVWLSGMSTMTFFTLNIERYLSIVHSVFHRNHVTKQKCFIFLNVLWSVCSVVAFGPFFSLEIDIIITLVASLICIGTFYMYAAIFNVARRRVNGITRNSIIIVGVESAVTASGIENQQQLEPRRSIPTATSQDFLLAKTCLVIVFTSLLCHLPNAIILGGWRESPDTINVIVHLKVWTHSLVAMNSTLNCLIFFWANKTLGNEGRQILKQLFCRNLSNE